MNSKNIIRGLGFSIALALTASNASYASVGDTNHPKNDPVAQTDSVMRDGENNLTDQVENGDLITTSGNGENSPASGDVGKNAYTGATPTRTENAATPVPRDSMGNQDETTEVAGSTTITTSDDTTVTTAVKTELAGTAGVNVSTKDGVVSLSGSVSSDAEKMRISKLAAEVDGVTQVDVSNLMVNDMGVDVAASDDE